MHSGQRMTLSPPSSEEFEISLFGAGVGESVVVHLGFGAWIVVDSCRDASRSPVALSYLKSIGTDPSSIVLIVATHWHDDHVDGLAELMRRAPSAKFVCSAALHTKQFFRLVSSGTRVLGKSSATDEFAEIFRTLEGRDAERARRGAAGPDHWAAAGMRLDSRNVGRETATVDSLSPSADSITRFVNDLAKSIPTLACIIREGPDSTAERA